MLFSHSAGVDPTVAGWARDGDRIVVVDTGRVGAVGTHEELVDQDRLYARPAAAQLRPVRREPTEQQVSPR